jgi:hypothetical protein
MVLPLHGFFQSSIEINTKTIWTGTQENDAIFSGGSLSPHCSDEPISPSRKLAMMRDDLYFQMPVILWGRLLWGRRLNYKILSYNQFQIQIFSEFPPRLTAMLTVVTGSKTNAGDLENLQFT